MAKCPHCGGNPFRESKIEDETNHAYFTKVNVNNVELIAIFCGECEMILDFVC
jgi:predicted nucleic-acid-binding Zn-ribbon protein